jgi:glucosamine kinase
MRYVLGFDGGGTKTECFVIDEHGNVLGRAQSGPSNPGRVGLGRAVDSITQSAIAAMTQARVERSAIAAICAGLSGAGDPKAAESISSSLAEQFPGAKIKVCTDLEIALAAVGDGPAIVLIAGTGSVAVGRGTTGGMRRAGGLGPQLGDEGSATDIGRKALAIAKMYRDKSGEESPLGKQMATQLGNAARNPSAEMFPRLFPVVANAADTDDEMARGILRDAAGHLAALVKTLVNELGLEKVPFRLAKSGGMIGRCAFFDDLLDRRLLHAAPLGKIGLLPILPAHAAALMALETLAEGGSGNRFA